MVSEPIAVTVPEAMFAARVTTAEPPRPFPVVRRGVFFDVENSSRPEHVSAVLNHLEMDWTARAVDLVAIGNWRVVSHETARLLAQRGALLVHSAPSVGIRDWSDLRIAVAAGAWLAAARPGDSVEIISDDQAFDAVGDVAATLGVRFHRLSFRALAGVGQIAASPEPALAAAPHHRARRGRYRRGPAPSTRPTAPAPPRRPSPEPPPAPAPPPPEPPVDVEAHTAPADEIKQVVEALLASSTGAVTLDAVGNALKGRGFRRTSGSPRLITRLRRLKGLEVTPRGIVRLIDSGPEEPSEASPPVATEAEAWVDDGPQPGNERQPMPADRSVDFEAGPAVTAPEGEGGGTSPARRRRRRGGRRWRGRGPGSAGSSGSPVAVGEAPRDDA
ncbi:MAG TPA: hypothetical protein VMT79_12925 [Candidatus Binatia bacterium]|nr:hypothetical protein [Candidatus Binatia bacterium]